MSDIEREHRNVLLASYYFVNKEERAGFVEAVQDAARHWLRGRRIDKVQGKRPA